MQLNHTDEENRILRKIIKGMELVYDELGQHLVAVIPGDGVGSLKENSKIQDASEYMKKLLAVNKIELLLDRVLYIHVESPYCRVVLDSKNNTEIDVRITLETLEHYFGEKALVKIHRSYLVNPKKVVCAVRRGVRDYEIWLRNRTPQKVVLPLARSYLEKIQQKAPKWFTN
ncbi:MAG: LytTR family transcriptional regulator [SAR324 cluster bacterium]|nr:LytTR family transcriptional regulator [SAR324 cluster bacterium]MBF0350003.1 LytTR family transcriptional regulator [SAR324 cluster bacterium]